MFSNIGGIAQAISFVFITLMVIHHRVTLDKMLINEAILQKEKEDLMDKDLDKKSTYIVGKAEISESKDKSDSKFTYREVFCFKLCCCKKKDKRYKAYLAHMETIRERMDVRSMVTNAGNINVLSNVLLEPYQIKLISQFKTKSDDETKLAKKISVKQAVDELQANLNN